MQLKTEIKRLVPFALALLIYTIFTLIYFAPQLSGDVLYQGDVMQYRGMAQEIIETREATGEDPQWSGSMFSGMPAYLINVDYPAQIIKHIGGAVTSIVDTPAAFIIFAMLAMWLMLVMMGVNGYVAIVGGAMYGLSTYFMLIIDAGHITKMWALVYAPPMMGAIFLAMRGNMLWGAALAALFTSLEVGANHPQITYYFLLGAAAFWLSELYFANREGRIPDFARRTALLAAAGVLGVLSNLAPLWYTAEHTPDTTRGGSELVAHDDSAKGGLDLEYATAWSYGKVESFNLLIPNFVGGDSAHSFAADGAVAKALKANGIPSEVAQQLPAYWGGQPFTGGPTYLGAVVIFLACVGFGVSRGRERWWILGVSVLMLLLAWGSHLMWFTELMFNVLPGYNKFRTVSMTLVVVEWSVPLLATYALAKLWRGEREGVEQVVFYSLAATAGVSALLALGSGVIFDLGYREGVDMLISAKLPHDMAANIAEAMVSERGAILASDAWRSVIYILLAAAAVVAFLRAKISRVVMLVVVGLLAVADLGGVAWRYLPHDKFVAPTQARFVASEADREIMADKGEVGYRVLNLTVSPFNDASTSYFHRSVGGYHGAKLSRYQDVIDKYLSRRDDRILDMLNTRYMIVPGADGSAEVVKRGSALGAAWFVERGVVAATPNEQINRIGEVDLSRSAVLESELGWNYGKGGEITLVDYKPHHLTYEYSSPEGGVALFSEIYYDKGWSAYIDGEEAEYVRADYLLRAMELPAGEHTVEWRFRAPRWTLIEGVTAAASLLILIFIIGLIALKIYENKQNFEA